MGNIITRALGMVDVEQDQNYITIGGVKAADIRDDILRLWGTKRIEANMFTRFDNRVIQFPLYFGPEVHYILGKILHTENAATSRGSIRSALKQLEENTWMQRITQDYPSLLDESRITQFKKRPLPHQVSFMQAYSARTQAYGLNGYLLSAGAGTGKAQPLNAKIKIPGGWTTMGKIKVGDTITAWDGNPTKVTGVFPQGRKDVYSITFEDGRTARTCGEHFWRIYNCEQVKILSTIDILELIDQGHEAHIDLCMSEDGPYKVLTNNPHDYGLRNDLTKIPGEYYASSREQRGLLMDGLLHSGCKFVPEQGMICYNATTMVLARDVQKLVWSNGGFAKIIDMQSYYCVHIKFPGKLRITKIERSGSEDCQCISIDHKDHLYVTDNYIVTHNTLTSLMLSEMLVADYIVIVCPKNAVYRVWASTLHDEYLKPRNPWVIADGEKYKRQRYIVAHFEGLEKLRQIIGSLSGRVVVLLDESHNLNSDESLRTERFIEVCRAARAQHVIWMSGTPVKALGIESIPLMRTIDPLFTPEVEKRFKAIYGRDASKALDILRQRMGMVSFNVESSAVVNVKSHTHTEMIKIPNGNAYTLDSIRTEIRKFIDERLKYYAGERKKYKRIFDEALDTYERTIGTPEDKKAFKIYKRYVDMISGGFDPKNMAAEARYCNHFEKRVIGPTLPNALRKQFMSAKSVIKYPQLKVLGEALGSVLGKKRVQCHVDMIPYMNLPKIIKSASKKTIIFSSYVEVVDAIAKHVKGEGFKPVVVHAQAEGDLTSLVSQFEKDPEANPLVATFQSLSTAVPLIMANCTVFTNVPFRDHELVQARARTGRLGQDSEVEYWYTYLDTGKEANISTRSRDILEWSRQQVAAILGKDYAGTITAEMVNAMESHVDELTPEELVKMSLAIEEYCDF